MHGFVRFALSSFVFALGIALAPHANAEPGDQYTVSLITMSPGDPIFFRFGHNGILVRDSMRRTQDIYNWGTFSFGEEGLIQKFLRGRLTYWLSRQPLGPTLAQYQSENRWLVEQQLNLTAQQKLELVRMVSTNARPENRKYRYHYYLDNCSTRVRDAIDTVVGGRLREAAKGPATYTYRQQTSRLVADVWWGYVFLNLAMGNFIDQPLTEWEEMFVPGKVQELVRTVQVEDETGTMVPLVKIERTLVAAPDRKPPPDAPPNRMLVFFAIGLLVGALFAWTGYRYLTCRREDEANTPLRTRTLGLENLGSRLALALPLGAWTALTGFLGVLFSFFWTMTDHEVAYHNENLLQTSPLTLGFPVIVIGLALDRAWARSAFKWLAFTCAGMSVCGLLLKALPWFDQVNGSMIALFMPVWLGLAVGPVLAERETQVEEQGSS